MPDPRSVLITGSSKGIGRATALRLDREGFRVIAGVRNEQDGQSLQRQASDRLRSVLLDVADAESIEKALRAVRAVTNELAGLVNNAGIVVAGPLEAVPMDEIRHQFEINVFGALAVTRAFLPLLRQGAGRIVNVSSVNGRIVTPFVGPYSASKFALEALSDGLRLELRPWSISVSVIQPGATLSSIWSTSTDRALANAARYDEAATERYGGVVAAIERKGGQAPKRANPPEKVAEVIARALTARWPRTRYIVGRDARLGAILASLPDRFKDWVLARR